MVTKKIKKVSFKTNIINIACSSDQNYSTHLSVMLTSCLYNLSPDFSLNITIIDGGIDQETKTQILDSIRDIREETQVRFIDIDRKSFQNYSTTKSISLATYYRIEIPNLLPNVDKIIYLDCDLIVLGDISSLWKIDFKNGFRIIACKEAELESIYSNLFKVNSNNGYFNAGVMIMDLKNLRIEKFTEKMHQLILSKDTEFSYVHDCDQKYLNYFFLNKWQEVDASWNVNAGYEFAKDYQDTPFSKEKFEGLFRNMKILHFPSRFVKPWKFSTPGNLKGIYFEYLRLTKFPLKKFNPSIFDLAKKFFFIMYYEYLSEKSRKVILRYSEIVYRFLSN